MRVVELVLLFWLGSCLLLVAIWLTVAELRRERREKLSRNAGTSLAGGSSKPSVSTTGKERGTRTQETATTAASSFYWLPGDPFTAQASLTFKVPASSSIAPGSSTGATAIPGASGARRERAV